MPTLQANMSHQEKFWDIHVFDGSTTHHFRRFGTLKGVYEICGQYPPSYRWTVN